MNDKCRFFLCFAIGFVCFGFGRVVVGIFIRVFEGRRRGRLERVFKKLIIWMRSEFDSFGYRLDV